MLLSLLFRHWLKSIMKEQIEEMEETGFPSIVFLTKDDVLPPIGEAKYKLVFGAAEDFWMQNSKTCWKTKILH